MWSAPAFRHRQTRFLLLVGVVTLWGVSARIQVLRLITVILWLLRLT